MATILAIILSNDKIEEFIQYFGIDASEYVICHAITTVYLSDEERKIGFLVVSHDEKLMEQVCDRIMRL